MSTINEFLPFADQSTANLIPYAEWVGAAKRLTGFASGIAKSGEMNRVFAQGANAGYAIAKFIERTLNEDVYVANADRLVDQFYRAIVQMSYKATPIGCILTFPVYTEIEGYVVTNFGGNLSRETYDLLFKVYGTKFNTASTAATQFGIPDMQHRFIECAATLQEIGAYVAAGLPNTSGDFPHNYIGTYSGATEEDRYSGGLRTVLIDTTPLYPTGTANHAYYHLSMDMSKSNSVYGASNTVQPSAMRSLVLVRAF